MESNTSDLTSLREAQMRRLVRSIFTLLKMILQALRAKQLADAGENFIGQFGLLQ